MTFRAFKHVFEFSLRFSLTMTMTAYSPSTDRSRTETKEESELEAEQFKSTNRSKKEQWAGVTDLAPSFYDTFGRGARIDNVIPLSIQQLVSVVFPRPKARRLQQLEVHHFRQDYDDSFRQPCVSAWARFGSWF